MAWPVRACATDKVEIPSDFHDGIEDNINLTGNLFNFHHQLVHNKNPIYMYLLCLEIEQKSICIVNQVININQ